MEGDVEKGHRDYKDKKDRRGQKERGKKQT